MLVSISLLLSSFIPALLLFGLNRTIFRELVLDLRLGRILHYFIVFLFGFTLYYCEESIFSLPNPETWINMGTFFMTLVYAAMFAIATNNREDLEIDKISNTNRPLVKQTIATRTYLFIAFVSLVLSLVLSAAIGWPYFMAIIGLSLVYFLYSCKPFRLKRIVILAKVLIGLNTLISAGCGYIIAGGNWQEFPLFWLLFILGPISLMANFVDLKDLEGDKKAGIQTIPVLFGWKKATYLIALFSVSSYGMVWWYFNTLWISSVLIICCSVHIYLLLQQPYREKPLFVLHNSLFLGLISLLLIQQYF